MGYLRAMAVPLPAGWADGNDPEEPHDKCENSGVNDCEDPKGQRPINDRVDYARDKGVRIAIAAGEFELPVREKAGTPCRRLQRHCSPGDKVEYSPPALAHEGPSKQTAKRNHDQANDVEEDDREVDGQDKM